MALSLPSKVESAPEKFQIIAMALDAKGEPAQDASEHFKPLSREVYDARQIDFNREEIRERVKHLRKAVLNPEQLTSTQSPGDHARHVERLVVHHFVSFPRMPTLGYSHTLSFSSKWRPGSVLFL
jgi:hypothetical protein